MENALMLGRKPRSFNNVSTGYDDAGNLQVGTTSTTTTEKKGFDFPRLLDVADQIIDTLNVAFGRSTSPATLPPISQPEKKTIPPGVVGVVIGSLAIVGTLVVLKLAKKI